MGVLPASLRETPQGVVPRWDITLCLSRDAGWCNAEVPCMGNHPASLPTGWRPTFWLKTLTSYTLLSEGFWDSEILKTALCPNKSFYKPFVNQMVIYPWTSSGYHKRGFVAVGSLGFSTLHRGSRKQAQTNKRQHIYIVHLVTLMMYSL